MKKGLIIRKFWLDKIFDEGKIWEMRSRKTNVRGTILLIESGSGMIVGEVDLIDCIKLDETSKKNNYDKHKVLLTEILEKYNFAWVLENAKRYKKPIPYKHPQGAVIWVNTNI